MRAAILAYDTDGVRELADAWNRAGFTADYIAVDLRQVPQDRQDDAHEWHGTLLRGGAAEDVDGAVAGLLSDLGPELVVLACLRSTDGTIGRPGAMRNLLGHLQIRAADAVEEVTVSGLDVVFPQLPDLSGPVTTNAELREFAVPPCPDGFWRIIISPEDSKAPGEPDVGVDEGSRESVTLHAALAVLGVLGGDWDDAELILGADLDQPVLVRAHSRMVAGGRDCYQHAAHFTTHELFSVTRGDCDPARYRAVQGEESANLQQATVDALRQRWGSVVTFRLPRLSEWIPPGRISLFEHLGRMLNFLPWALKTAMLGIGESAGSAVQRFMSRLVTNDQGYHVGPKFSQKPGEWWTWLVVDEVNAMNARNEIQRHDRMAADPVNATVWRDLVGTACGMCDGATLPVPVPESDYQGRRLLLRGEDAAEDLREQRGPAADFGLAAVSAPAPAVSEPAAAEVGEGPDAGESVEQAAAVIEPAIVAELQRCEPIRPSVQARAYRLAAQHPPVLSPDSESVHLQRSKVVRSAVALADEEDAEGVNVARARGALFAGQADAGSNLLGRLRAASLADLLVTATEAARWSAAATRRSRIQPEVLERAVRVYTWVVRILALIAIVFAVVWYRYGEGATQAFNDVTGNDVTPMQVAAVVAVLLLLVLLGFTAHLYQVYSAEAEKARRAIEARSRALASARECLSERNRLRSVDRIQALWNEVLSWSIAGSVRDEVSFDPHIDDARGTRRPVALQVALPVMGEIQRRHMNRALEMQATQPGWRGQWLDALIKATGVLPPKGLENVARSQRPLSSFFADDDGIGSTQLRELSDQVSGLRPRSEVTAQWIAALDEDLAVAYFADEHCLIDVPYVAVRLPVTQWGRWFEPLQSESTFRHVLDPTAQESAAERLRRMAGYPRVLAKPAHGTPTPVHPRSPGATALQVRLEAVLLNETSLKLAEFSRGG